MKKRFRYGWYLALFAAISALLVSVFLILNNTEYFRKRSKIKTYDLSSEEDRLDFEGGKYERWINEISKKKAKTAKIRYQSLRLVRTRPSSPKTSERGEVSDAYIRQQCADM